MSKSNWKFQFLGAVQLELIELMDIFYTKYTFFYKQSVFDPRPENFLSLSKKSPQKIV